MDLCSSGTSELSSEHSFASPRSLSEISTPELPERLSVSMRIYQDSQVISTTDF